MVERRGAEDCRQAISRLAEQVKSESGTALPSIAPTQVTSWLSGSAEGVNKSVNQEQPAPAWVAVHPQGAPCSDSIKPTSRAVDDGLLLIIPIRVFGKEAQALVDSGATRSFVSPKGTVTLGLHCTTDEAVLELADGTKILSKGKAPHVPITAAGRTTKVDLTVTPLLQDVDIILGINWLQAVNPLIDWTGPRLILEGSVTTSTISGQWVDSTMKVGTVTVLRDAAALSALSRPFPPPLAVLGAPTFWAYASSQLAWRRRSLGGDGMVAAVGHGEAINCSRKESERKLKSMQESNKTNV